MRLKGEMVIELTDTNTGAVETVQETNMIGGILLFPAVLEEKADHIYEQGKNLPVAYASNNVNSGSNVARGSLSQTESKKLDNGYKFVWEFTPSQGNGNIAAVRLIWPCMSGKCGPAVCYNRLYACAGGLLIIDRKNRVFCRQKCGLLRPKHYFVSQNADLQSDLGNKTLVNMPNFIF